MGKKITQYPASAGNPDVTSLIDISEFDGSIYTSKKLSITQLIDFLNTNLNLGSSFTFKNNTGDTISKGMAVELSGASGLDLPEIALLSSSFSDVGLSQIFIANEDILNGNSGNFIQNGFLDNWYTIGLTVGQKIFWDVPSQSLTVVGTDIDQVFVGIVTVVDANGQLFVSPTRGTRTLTSQLVNDGSDTINPFITALDVPAVPTLTSELTNDGADTINPFITALDIPAVPTLTSELTNDGEDGLNPFITALDIPTFASADKMVTVGRNSTGSTLYKGTIVYILGSTGNRPNFVKARADVEATSAGTFGVIENNILNNADGNCVTIGAIDNLDTRSTATHPFTVDTLVDGDTIYLSPTTAGYITNVKPTAPDHLVYMGKVVETSPTNGTIVYRIQNGYELQELHNVAISSVTNNDILQYETSTSLWKNKAIPTASGSVNGYLSSTDWTTFNNKVATTRTLTINGTAQDLSADRSWTIASSAIPQANKIYVDSINGVNLTGRGNINNPYLTPEYALSDITNTGTVTATTTNLSATLTAVSSTANIVVGQFITGTGIPYNSIVVSKTSNTIVLSKVCTAGATITATWWTIYEVILNGNFVVTSNIHKTGFYINSKSLGATISYGNLALFTFTANILIPLYLSLGKTFGTHADSGLINPAGFTAIEGFLDLGNYYSICTGYNLGNPAGASYLTFTNLTINTEMFDCRFGYVSLIAVSGNFTWNGNAYGLLGGLRYTSLYVDINTKITTPASILAINGSGRGNINGNILGSYTHGGGINLYANIVGTTALIDGGDSVKTVNVYGSLTVTTTTLGSSPVILNGDITGNVVVTGLSSTIGSTLNGSINGTITVNSGSIKFNGNQEGTHPSRYMTVIIGSGTFINSGLIRLLALTYTGAGKFVNDGTILTSAGTNTSAPIKITNAGKFVNNKDIIFDNTVDYMPLIEKTSGVLINNGRMSNPCNMYVKYVANTSVSKEVILAYAMSNGNTYGNSTSGTGEINKFGVVSANTDTILTIFDGTNTVVISVIGAGKSIAVISAEIVTLIKASILLFQNCSYASAFGVIIFIPRAGFTATFTITTNIGSIGTYAGGGGYAGTLLGTGTELLSSSYNY